MRILCCLLLLIIGLDGAERADIKRELADCAKAAYERGDLWTLIQIQAWADAHKQRLRPFLSSSRIIGSPLLATPDEIEYFIDCGDCIVARTGNWLYRWSPDGRPLNPGLKKDSYIGRWAINPRGRLVGSIVSNHLEDGRNVDVVLAVDDLSTGEERWSWRKRLPIGPNASRMELAADGSAVALAIRDSQAARPDLQYRASIIRPGAEPETILDVRNVYGVGPDARWLIVTDQQGINLQRGETREPIQAWAAGPDGRLAWAGSDGQLRLLDLKGQEHLLNPGFNQDLALISRGPNLVVATGAAYEREETDVFGETTRETVHGSWLIFPWSACGATLPPPLMSGDGQIRADDNHPWGLLICSGRDLLRLLPDIDDEGQPCITRVRLYRADTPLATAWNEGWHLRCQTESGRSLVISESGRLLLDLEGDIHLSYAGRDLMIERSADGLSYDLHRLSEDIEARQRQHLQLPQQDDLDPIPDVFGQQLAMTDWSTWYLFALPALNPLGSINRNDEWRYDRVGIRYAPGRFGIAGARLIAKNRPIEWDPGNDPEGWQFADAAHHPLGIVAAMRSGAAIAFDRRGKDKEVARLPSAECSLLTIDREPIIAVCDQNEERRFGTIDKRGQWLPLPDGVVEAAPDQNGPQGSWQVEHRHRVYPPKAGRIEWPHRQFPVRHLRSHKLTQSLLVICDSIIIELSTSDAKKLQQLWKDVL